MRLFDPADTRLQSTRCAWTENMYLPLEGKGKNRVEQAGWPRRVAEADEDAAVGVIWRMARTLPRSISEKAFHGPQLIVCLVGGPE